MQYTTEQLEGFRAAYKVRWRLTYVPTALIFMILLLSLFLSVPDRWMGRLWLGGIAGMTALSLIIYRCPACGAHLGGRRRLRLYYVCRYCGVQLSEETRGSDTESEPVTPLARLASRASSYFVPAVLLIILLLGVGYIFGYLPHDELGWHSVGQTNPLIYVGTGVFCCGLFLGARYGGRLSEIEYAEAHDQWLTDCTTSGVELSWALSPPEWIKGNAEARRLLTRVRVAIVLVVLPVVWLVVSLR